MASNDNYVAKIAPNGVPYGDDFEDFDEFSWFLERQPGLANGIYSFQKQENLKVIEEHRAAGMNDFDLQQLLYTQCCNRISHNDDDRDYWLRDLSKSGH